MVDKRIQYLAAYDLTAPIAEQPEPHQTILGRLEAMGVVVLDREADTAQAHAVIAEISQPYEEQVSQIVRAKRDLGKSVLLLRNYSVRAVALPEELEGVGGMGVNGCVTYSSLHIARVAVTTYMGVSFEGEPRIYDVRRTAKPLSQEMRANRERVASEVAAELDAADAADSRLYAKFDQPSDQA